MISEALLKILVCPLCKNEVVFKDEKLVCTKCAKIYPIKDGIPVMLAEEAKRDEKK